MKESTCQLLNILNQNFNIIDDLQKKLNINLPFNTVVMAFGTLIIYSLPFSIKQLLIVLYIIKQTSNNKTMQEKYDKKIKELEDKILNSELLIDDNNEKIKKKLDSINMNIKSTFASYFF